jgi:hypothetical protein
MIDVIASVGVGAGEGKCASKIDHGAAAVTDEQRR